MVRCEEGESKIGQIKKVELCKEFSYILKLQCNMRPAFNEEMLYALDSAG